MVAADGNGWGVSKESDERVEPMTYTFKLSRRLAVSRYAMLAAAAVLVGCDSETTTAPEPDLHPVPVLDRVHLFPKFESPLKPISLSVSAPRGSLRAASAMRCP